MLRCLFPLLILLFTAATAAAAPPTCVVPSGGAVQCAISDVRALSDGGGPVVLRRIVVVESQPGSGEPPLTVRITALASSEVHWNGRLIGRNGRPGDNRQTEIAGRIVADFIVPSDLVRPGANRLDIRLSSHWLLMSVSHPLHEIRIGPHDDALDEILRRYLPALTLGAGLALAGAGFVAAYIRDRSRRGALLLAAMAAAVILQLIAETLRAFFAYTYVWHLPRLAVVALCAALTGVLAARYAAWRYAPAWQGHATGLAAGGSLLAVAVTPGFDIKTIVALLIGLTVVAVCAIHGLRRGLRTAWAALAAVALALGLIVVQGAAFLDSGYYVAIAAVFAALLFEQFGPAALRAASAPPALPEPPVSSPPAAPDAVVVITGRDRRLVAVEAIRAVRAADDYCEVLLTDGRVLLHTAPLARILEAVPSLQRVHRSHAVNPDHVVGAKSGDGLKLILDGLRPIPVGRTYRAQAEALLAARGL